MATEQSGVIFFYLSENAWKRTEYIIGASVSEPHTSELNGGISLVYIIIYIVRMSKCTHTRAAYGHYARDLIGNTCAAFIVRFLLLVVNMYILNTSRRALKPS